MDDFITIHVGGDALKRLNFIADEMETTENWLCHAAIEEAALNFFRNRSDDPTDEPSQ